MREDGRGQPAARAHPVLDEVERAIADIAAGRPVVVVDDADRENEGDIIFAAEQDDAGADGVHDPLHQRRDLRAAAPGRTWTGWSCR